MMVPVPPSEPLSGRSSRAGSKCRPNARMVPLPPSEPSSGKSSRASSKQSRGARRLGIPAVEPCSVVSSDARRRSNSCDVSSIATKYSSSLRQFSQARGHLPPLRPSASSPKHSEEELLDDLKGYNGKWKQQRAGAELERLADQKRERDLQDRLEEEKKQMRRGKEQSILKAIEQEQEEERQKVNTRKKEREYAEQQKVEAERERQRQVLQKIAAERRRSVLRVTCETCSGSGLCLECSGKGCHSAFYLSATVREGSQRFHGLTMSGCEACGGRKAGAMQVDGLPGTGKCCDCNGWGSKPLEEVEAYNRRVKRAGQACIRKRVESGNPSETASTTACGSGCNSDADESVSDVDDIGIFGDD